MAKPLHNKGIETSCKVCWIKFLYDVIITRVKETGLDLAFCNGNTAKHSCVYQHFPVKVS